MARYDVLISLGSNVEPEHWLPIANALLSTRFHEVVCSRAYRSEAVGTDVPRPAFLNQAARFRTDLPYRALRTVLRHMEARCGRRRGPDRFAPRTLDLDIVHGDDAFRASCPHGVALPDPELFDQLHVLVPCAELWPDVRATGSGETLAAHAAAVPPEVRTRLVPVALDQEG
jgi:2-amino-4-hydroxy-6-hydroxymethyldihydropteridine diphosphokinase